MEEHLTDWERLGHATPKGQEEGDAPGVGSTSIETKEWRKFFIPSLRQCSRLHHVEGFQDDNLCTALQHRAPLGLRDGLVERVGLDDRIAAGHAQLRAITD
jgi:hypothetical protein